MPIPKIESYSMPNQSDIPTSKLNWSVHPGRAALLIHDMQEYFLNAYDQQADPYTTLVDNITELKQVCTTLGIPIIYSAQPRNQKKEERGLLQDFWGDGIPNDPKAEKIIEALSPDDMDIRITKWRYSAFQKTSLFEDLKKQGRDQLIITGVYAHIGCMLTAAEAFMKDFQTFFIADALADFSLEDHHMALQYAHKRCAVVETNERIRQQLQDQRQDFSFLPKTKIAVHRQVAQLMERSPADIRDDESLIIQGLDSLRMMILAEGWRHAGADISLLDLVETPTINAWWSLLAKEEVFLNTPNTDYDV
ncbi:isochorismatase family protein [Salicibibacter cibarius]|uniref:isochorismatase n=1 Tax=Salicibibacter cibarius TaxID=2743000 RepID=A0A7T6Z6G5_9BACI|nr:isochorismatase family protein [Salicibibacter cibarius]QQK77678.1 isochorismatase family protein [Salicibibacter cibarius]